MVQTRQLWGTLIRGDIFSLRIGPRNLLHTCFCNTSKPIFVVIFVIRFWKKKLSPDEAAGEATRVSVDRRRANMAHVRPSRPDSGLGFQVEVAKIFGGVPFSLSPPSSDYGTCRTVKARFWPWLSGSSRENLEVLRTVPSLAFRSRS